MKHSSKSSMEFRANGSPGGKMHQPHDPYRGDSHDLKELKKSLADCLSQTKKAAYETEEIVRRS